MSKPQWHIFGAGAMGALWQEQFSRRGVASVLLHHRDGKKQFIVRHEKSDARHEAVALNTHKNASIQRMLLATKANRIAQAMELAKPYLAEGAIVVTTANGLGFLPGERADSSKHTLVRAVTTAGAHRHIAQDGTHHVEIVSWGDTSVGHSVQGDNEHTAPAWFLDSLATLDSWYWQSPIDEAVNRKFAINCIINPLTALLKKKNGELLQEERTRLELKALCAETEAVLRELSMWQGDENLFQVASAVCVSTAANQSSMLQDRLAKRESELDFLNGELLRRAAAIGWELPENLALIKALRHV